MGAGFSSPSGHLVASSVTVTALISVGQAVVCPVSYPAVSCPAVSSPVAIAGVTSESIRHSDSSRERSLRFVCLFFMFFPPNYSCNVISTKDTGKALADVVYSFIPTSAASPAG